MNLFSQQNGRNLLPNTDSTKAPIRVPQTTEARVLIEWKKISLDEMDVSSSQPIPREEICEVATPVEREAPQQAQKFLSSVESLINNGKRTDAIDKVYNEVEDLLLARKFESVRWIIEASAQYVERATVPLSIFLSLLIVTRPWKNRFRKETSELVTNFFKRAIKDKGPKDALELVRGHL